MEDIESDKLMNFLVIIRELRQWLITIILVVIASGIVWQVRSCGTKELETANEKLKREVQELKNMPPVVKMEVITKERRVKVCIDRKTKKEVVCDSEYNDVVEVEITKEMCCSLGLGTKFSNEFIDCTDVNICTNGDEKIEWTKEGLRKFGRIEELVGDIGKKSIWNISAVAGGDFIKPGFLLGVNVINWHNVILGGDVVLDTKNFKSSDIGLFLGYRPQFKKWYSNFAFIGGIGTQVDSFGKRLTGQVGIVFFFIERR